MKAVQFLRDIHHFLLLEVDKAVTLRMPAVPVIVMAAGPGRVAAAQVAVIETDPGNAVFGRVAHSEAPLSLNNMAPNAQMLAAMLW
jgi:hypothetical protein